MMKTHFQPLTPRQLYHILTHYQLGTKQAPVIWTPSREEMDELSSEGKRFDKPSTNFVIQGKQLGTYLFWYYILYLTLQSCNRDFNDLFLSFFFKTNVNYDGM